MGAAALLLANGLQHPADAQRLLPVAIHLHRNLVGSTTNSLGTHFNRRLHVFNGAVENLDWFDVRHLLGNDIHGLVEDGLRHALLSVDHQAVHELARHERPIPWIWAELLAAGRNFSHIRLTLFRPVQTAGLLATLHAERVEGTADNVIPHARQVANTTATHEHDRMFLEVVAFARNVNSDFFLIGQTHASDLSQSRIWLLGRHRPDLQAHAPLLRATVEHRGLRKFPLRPAAVVNELADRGHTGFFAKNVSEAPIDWKRQRVAETWRRRKRGQKKPYFRPSPADSTL